MATSTLPAPVPDRPLTVLDIVDGAFSVVRQQPKTVAAIVAAFVLPTQLISAFSQRGLFEAFNSDTFQETGQLGGNFSTTSIVGGSIVGAALAFVVLPFIGAALTHLVQGWKQGEQRSAATCVLFTLKKAHILLAAFVACKVLQLFTLLLATPALLVVAPIIAEEDLGPIAAIKRSWELSRPRLGPLFGLLVVIAIVNQLLSSAIAALPTIAAFLLADWGWIAFFALNSITTALLNIMAVGSSVLVYDDLRNRGEGRDLLERMRSMSSDTLP